MARAALLALSVTTLTTANIIFPFVQPGCDFYNNPSACLKGQGCIEDNSCIPLASINSRATLATPPRSDGRCGHSFDDAACDPNGAYGPCCSSHGYCGKTPAHCLLVNGCQSGCESLSPTSSALSLTASISEPVIGPGVSSATPSASAGPVTTDGTCGDANGGSVCGNWVYGSCCSMYGFCGNTTAHCGKGCQSGPCNQAPVAPAPGPSPAPLAASPGSFKVVGDSGVPVMHAALMPNGRVAFLDKVENYTHLNLPDGQLAYSAEYDPATNEVVPLVYRTNAFCSGGSFLADGTLVNVGGNAPLTWLDPTVGNGFRGLRYLTRSATESSLDGEAWNEPGNLLDTKRWYASVQTMPDGTLFVASGSLNGLTPADPKNNNPTYEILDQTGRSLGQSIPMELLKKAEPYYMYPFIHLLSDGTLFVFTSKNGEVFNVASNEVIKELPELPGEYRTYPNTGGSVLLPLSSTNNWTPDIVICGGGAYQDITSPTDPSCGRIQPLSAHASWEMDSMPEGRGMVEGTLLPDGTILWLNGAQQGAEGFELALKPALEALIYDPAAPLGQRWSRGASSTIARLYHSVALLLLDGTVMISGSNPWAMPVLEGTEEYPYPTEFRVEIYTPPYLSGDNAGKRPTDVVLSSTSLTANSETFTISFTVPDGAQAVKIVLYHGGFVTHSLHMSHRMLFLDYEGWSVASTEQTLQVTMPPSGNVAPPGPYIVYIVADGVPSVGQFVMVR